MALLGQSSGGWLESSSALRILHVGVRNSVGQMTEDAFTQTNPPNLTTAATIASMLDTTKLGVLSGTVAFARPDEGDNFVGGPVEAGTAHQRFNMSPLGMFINSSAGNAFENQPAVASNKNPYVSAQGTYATSLFEDQAAATTGAYTLGDDLTYTAGMGLMASRNGYLVPTHDSAVAALSGTAAWSSEVTNGRTAATTIAILKMPSDSTQPEIVFDQRI
jgi:hypothetical protein